MYHSDFFLGKEGLRYCKGTCLGILSKVLQCQQPLWLVFPWCLFCRQVTGTEFYPARHFFFQHTSLVLICTRILYCGLSWSSLTSKFVLECQTLTYVKFCRYDGLLGCSSLQYQANSSPIVCTALALDNRNCCSGKQGPNTQHLPVNVCLRCLHWIRGSRPPCGRDRLHIMYLISFIFICIHCLAI